VPENLSKQLLDWLRVVLLARIEQSEEDGPLSPLVFPQAPPELVQFLPLDLRRPGADANLDLLVIVALALAASFPVHEISQFFHDNRETVGFGIVKGDFAAEFLPTVQTAISVLAGDDHARALQVRQCFAPDGPLQKKGIIRLAPQRDVHRLVAHTFSITQEYFLRFTTGQEFRPSFSHEFPAKQIRTRHEWRDLVLTPETSSQVKEIQLWLRHKHTFLHEWGQIRQAPPGVHRPVLRTTRYGQDHDCIPDGQGLSRGNGGSNFP
jgi:hypothetical protein